jgi:hypothetical protein
MWDIAFGEPQGFDLSLVAALLSTSSSNPKHRSPGGRAHRRWRMRRSSGRA